MKRRIIAVLVMSMLLMGCGKSAVVEEYPGMNSEEISNLAGDSVQNTADSGIEGDVIKYDIINNKGNLVYEINAEKIGSEKDPYPVLQVAYQELDDSFVQIAAKAVFDSGSVSVIMPYTLADLDYVNNRLEVLERRKADDASAGRESLPYIDTEIGELTKLIDRNEFANRDTIACPDGPAVIDLSDYYLKNGNINTEVNFCYLEGTIEGEFYRMDMMTLMNNRTIRIYREQSNDSVSEEFTVITDEANMVDETDGETLTKENAIAQYNAFLKKLTGQEIDVVATYPATIFGNMDKSKMLYQKPGYVCFSSVNIDGRYFPVSELTSFFGTDVTETNYMLHPQYIGGLANNSNVQYMLSMSKMEKEKGSGVYYSGYQSLSGCVDNKGIVEIYITNIMTDPGQNFKYIQNTPMISFEEADERARKYLTYLADNPSEGITHKIKRIELAMCRIISDDNYFVVPAWYYMQQSVGASALPRPAVVVNAIDGSIIDVVAGGTKVDFQ